MNIPASPSPAARFASKDMSFLVDPQGVIDFATRDAEQFYGAEGGGLRGRSIFDLVAPSSRAEAQEWWTAFTGGPDAGSGAIEVLACHPDSFPPQVQLSAWRLGSSGQFLLTHRLYDHDRERLETLYSILLMMSGTLELDKVLDIVLEQSLRLIPADSATLFLIDQNGSAHLLRSSGLYASEYAPAEVDTFATFKTVAILRETGRPLLIHDCTDDPRWTRALDTDYIRSWVGAPLMHRGEFLGVLNMNSTQPGRFSPEDAELLQALASQAAAALYNARAYEDEQRRARQLAAITDVSTALGYLDLEGLLEVVYQKVSRLMDATTFYIGLYNPETNMLQITGAYEHGFQRADEMQRADIGLAGSVIRTRQPVIIVDTGIDPLPQEAIIDGEVPQSVLMMPLVAQEEVVGVISVQSYRPNAYTPQDIALLETLAGPIASTIQNVQLFDETASRLAMLEALHRLGLALAAGHDIEGVARLLLGATHDLFQPREAWVYLMEDPTWGPAYQIGQLADTPDEVDIHRGKPVLAMTGLERSLRGIQPVVLTEDHPEALAQFATRWPLRAAATCPIRYGGQILGTLALLYDHPHPLSSDTLRALELVCTQAATAFDNARYHLALTRRLKEVSALHELAQRVSSSQSLDDILRTVVHAVQEAFDCRSASIALLDETEGMVVTRASIGIDPQLLPQARFKLGEPAAGQVVATGSALYVPDTLTSRNFRVIDPAIRSLLCVPLTIQDRAIGALSIDSAQPYAFTSHHEHLLTIAGGQIAAAIQTMRLLDEARKHADQLAKANASLEELNVLRDELIANVSHELRSPLALVRGYAGLLRAEEMGAVTEEQASVLAIIDDKAQSIGRLIDDILMLERISRETLELGVVDLTALCEQACQGAALVHTDRKLRFETELTSDTYIMEGDRDRLNQVLDNLLGNAAKFSPDGGTITLNTQVNPARDRFAISISDQGIGIPADKLPHIFERFYQVDRSIKQRYGGAGLGLSIVQRIIAAHGGEVYVQSEEGKGSTFTVVLPLEPGQLHGDH